MVLTISVHSTKARIDCCLPILALLETNNYRLLQSEQPEPPKGLEPSTYTLQKCCSTIELKRQNVYDNAAVIVLSFCHAAVNAAFRAIVFFT